MTPMAPSWLRTLTPYIAAAIALFALGAVVGALAPQHGDDGIGALKRLADYLRGRSALEIIAAIFLKNASAAALAIVLGMGAGLVPALAAVGNGVVVGSVMASSGNAATLWLQLIPHGIFELPAVFVAWALGLWLGASLLVSPLVVTVKQRLKTSLRIYVRLVLPLLALAAVIEGGRVAAA